MSSETPRKAQAKSPRDHREELGIIFTSLREEKNYSLETLSEKTKVPLHALKKMEEGHEDFYKERLYSKGFMSLICRELKVDPKNYLEKMKACEEPILKNTHNVIEKDSLSQVKKLRARKVFGFKSLLVTFIGLLAFGYYFYAKNIGTSLFKNKEKQGTEEKLQSVNKNQNCLNHKPKEFQNIKNVSCLSLIVNASTMIKSQYDKRKPQKIFYKEGLHHFYYKDSLDFVFYDASQVELIIDNENQGVLSKKKEEKKLSFLAKKQPIPSA